MDSRMSMNMSSTDKDHLLELINKYKHIIEDKKNDVKTIEKKRLIWEVLCKEFNSIEGITKRTIIQLRKQWSNIKQHAKKGYAAVIRERKRTGGGPSQNDTDMNSLTRVISIVPSQIIPPYSEFDEDEDDILAENKSEEQNTPGDMWDHSYSLFTGDIGEASQKNTFEYPEVVSLKNETKRKKRITRDDILHNEVIEHNLRMKILRMKLKRIEEKRRNVEEKRRRTNNISILLQRQMTELHNAQMLYIKYLKNCI